MVLCVCVSETTDADKFDMVLCVCVLVRPQMQISWTWCCASTHVEFNRHGWCHRLNDPSQVRIDWCTHTHMKFNLHGQMFRGGGGASHKYQSLWSFTQKIMEYQWVCCPLSSTLPLPHPPDSSSSVPAVSDREPLPLLHHWNLLPIRVSSLEDSGLVSSPSSLEDSAPVTSSA